MISRLVFRLQAAALPLDHLEGAFYDELPRCRIPHKPTDRHREQPNYGASVGQSRGESKLAFRTYWDYYTRYPYLKLTLV